MTDIGLEISSILRNKMILCGWWVNPMGHVQSIKTTRYNITVVYCLLLAGGGGGQCSQTCQNGGVCVGTSCQCSDGFSGAYCQTGKMNYHQRIKSNPWFKIHKGPLHNSTAGRSRLRAVVFCSTARNRQRATGGWVVKRPLIRLIISRSSHTRGEPVLRRTAYPIMGTQAAQYALWPFKMIDNY